MTWKHPTPWNVLIGLIISRIYILGYDTFVTF